MARRPRMRRFRRSSSRKWSRIWRRTSRRWRASKQSLWGSRKLRDSGSRRKGKSWKGKRCKSSWKTTEIRKSSKNSWTKAKNLKSRSKSICSGLRSSLKKNSVSWSLPTTSKDAKRLRFKSTWRNKKRYRRERKRRKSKTKKRKKSSCPFKATYSPLLLKPTKSPHSSVVRSSSVTNTLLKTRNSPCLVSLRLTLWSKTGRKKSKWELKTLTTRGSIFGRPLSLENDFKWWRTW